MELERENVWQTACEQLQAILLLLLFDGTTWNETDQKMEYCILARSLYFWKDRIREGNEHVSKK